MTTDRGTNCARSHGQTRMDRDGLGGSVNIRRGKTIQLSVGLHDRGRKWEGGSRVNDLPTGGSTGGAVTSCVQHEWGETSRCLLCKATRVGYAMRRERKREREGKGPWRAVAVAATGHEGRGELTGLFHLCPPRCFLTVATPAGGPGSIAFISLFSPGSADEAVTITPGRKITCRRYRVPVSGQVLLTGVPQRVPRQQRPSLNMTGNGALKSFTSTETFIKHVWQWCSEKLYVKRNLH
uniref:Uncharacterized protein n=1 Tax=Timema bartmani TaxID=61472 RepID=A0A7R9EN84_9NEOP|nr:unnamed protein product [Timema bartmani]